VIMTMTTFIIVMIIMIIKLCCTDWNSSTSGAATAHVFSDAVSYINPYSNIEERNAYHAQALCPLSSSSWNSNQSSSCGCISCSVVRSGSLSLYPTTCCSFTLTNHCFPISISSMIFSGVRSEAEQREQISS